MKGSRFDIAGLNKKQAGSLVRRGALLMEVVVTITLTTMVMASVAIALHGMYRADQSARHDLQWSQNLDRLAARVRNDAHEAASAQVQNGAMLFQLGSQKSVEYKLAAGGIERTVRQQEETVHHDSFLLTQHATATWQVDQETSFAVLQISRTTPPQSASEEILRIEARVGLDRRFEKRGGP